MCTLLYVYYVFDYNVICEVRSSWRFGRRGGYEEKHCNGELTSFNFILPGVFCKTTATSLMYRYSYPQLHSTCEKNETFATCLHHMWILVEFTIHRSNHSHDNGIFFLHPDPYFILNTFLVLIRRAIVCQIIL